LTKRKIVSLGLLFIGLVVFVHPFTASTLSVGVLLGIASGILEGSAHAFRKYLKNVQREVIVFFQSISGVVVGAIMFFLVSDSVFMKEFSWRGIAVALLFGGLLVAIGYLLAYGFGHYDVNIGTVILATELFFALIINYFVLRESPTVSELVGGTIIFAGAILNNITFKRQPLYSGEKFDD
jgi:drug/metabolite transporter (DMT)-like permease